MFTRKHAGGAVVIAIAMTAGLARAEGPNLGKPISQVELAAWDISILPDGSGLPAGNGTPAEGSRVFAQKCAACHGENGKGGINAALVSSTSLTGISAAAKTIPNFWPYATTVFDFIRRAMPFQQPKSLTNDEVYAVTAFILAQNKLIGDSDTMNAQTLPKVRMPNRDGFIIRFADKI